MNYRDLSKEECVARLYEQEDELHRLRESAERYQALFRNANVSLWEEDCSVVRRELDRLKEEEGVNDIRAYLQSYPQITRELVKKIRVLDVNDVTMELYGAQSKDELLGSLDSVFVEETEGFFIEAMTAIAERRSFIEGETRGRTLRGEPLHLLIRMSIPYGREQHDYVLLSIVDITRRKEREEEYARLLKVTKDERTRAESMREVSLALTSTFDRSRVLDTILRHARRLVDFTAANVSIWEKGELRLVRFDGYSRFGVKPEQVEAIYNQNQPRNVDRELHRNEPVLIPDTADDPNWIVFPETQWVKSFLGMPLTYGDEVIGLINFDGEQPEQFSDQDIHRLEPFAHAAAVALENSRLYAKIQEELEERTAAEQRLRLSLREKETLLEEIHHRVKNNLNVVGSMLNLELGRINTVEEGRDALRVSETRIQSMALVHEHLYQSGDLSAVDMRTYLESITEQLRQIYAPHTPVDLELSRQQIFMDIHQAIPLGLILNELISNAFEHAIVPCGTGKLAISLSLRGQDLYELRVKDDGCGIPEEISLEDSETMGLHLVMILSEQLGGNVRALRQQGTEFVLSFPVYRR